MYITIQILPNLPELCSCFASSTKQISQSIGLTCLKYPKWILRNVSDEFRGWYWGNLREYWGWYWGNLETWTHTKASSSSLQALHMYAGMTLSPTLTSPPSWDWTHIFNHPSEMPKPSGSCHKTWPRNSRAGTTRGPRGSRADPAREPRCSVVEGSGPRIENKKWFPSQLRMAPSPGSSTSHIDASR